MSEVNWDQFWALLNMLPGLPLQEAKEPLTGFLGPQRTASGHPATWIHSSMNVGGLEWLIPLLTPNQTTEILRALLSDKPLTQAQRDEAEDKAYQFAVEKERQEPGTFAKYPTVLEAYVAAMSPSKNLIVRPLPEWPTPTPLPGRER